LWLAGYDVPLRAVQRILLRFVERHLSQLTHGKSDYEEILDHISMLMCDRLIPKWKFSPKTQKVLRDFGIDLWAELVECFFDLIVMPDYIPDTELIGSLLMRMAERSGTASTQATIRDPEQLEKMSTSLQQGIERLFAFCSLPRAKEALLNADPEEWKQARSFYQKLYDSASIFLECMQRHYHEPLLADAKLHHTVIAGAEYLLPLLLVFVHYGNVGKTEYWLQLFSMFATALQKYNWPSCSFEEALEKFASELRESEQSSPVHAPTKQ
jgi:hypothetical protein